FLPATKAQPKAMLPLVDKPIVQYLVEEAVKAGIEQIIFVTGKGKRAIEDHFDSHFELEYLLEQKGKEEVLSQVRGISDMAEFFFVRQKYARGNGDAVLATRSFIGDEPCAVLFEDDIVASDIPAIGQLIEIYNKYQDPVIALTRVPHSEVSKYGIIEGSQINDRLFEINKFVEKPKPEDTKSNLAVIGKYIITPSIFDKLEEIKNSVTGELGLDNAFIEILKTNPLYGYEIEGKRYDCGDKLGYVQAVIDFGLQHSEIGRKVSEYIKNIKL
ncbi:UTP--glucose-1-phosphate uridylyltransferase, partial [bacterium]|nr:UTP--glucose-1-phosphate uridylyltransferase [Candidatus Elulimicrobium humile]